MSSAPVASPVALLDAIVRDALDPSYAEAAARHQAEDRLRDKSPGATRRTSLIGVGLLLGAGAIAGIAVSSEQRVLPQVGAARSALAGNAGESTRQVSALEQTVRDTQREISALQQQQLAASATGRQLQARAGALRAAAGQTPVSGPGVDVTVSDAAAAVTTDRELQDVVNALWAGGAKAISVGGVRLGPQTSIRTAGETILVGFHALSSPYSIKAIAGPDLLTAAGQAPAFVALSKATPGVHPDLTITASTGLSLPAASAAKFGAGQALSDGGH